MHRTRIKICGLTRPQDVRAAVAAGADAIGLVFYPDSPRYVTPEQARALVAALPPFASAVGLFVNASVQEVAAAVQAAPFDLLQFHGDETPDECAALAQSAGRPFLRAFRVRPDAQPADLLEYEERYRAASPLFRGLLLDSFVDAYGGAGKVFDWSVIPNELAPRAVLSGGLSAHNATGAVLRVRPFAVDASSSVESAKGIKDAGKIAEFIAAIRLADATIAKESQHEGPT